MGSGRGGGGRAAARTKLDAMERGGAVASDRASFEWRAANKFSHLFLLYMGSFISFGKKHTLEQQDTVKPAGYREGEGTDEVSERFAAAWEARRKHKAAAGQPLTKYDFLKALVVGSEMNLLVSGVLYLLFQMSQVAGPILMERIIKLIIKKDIFFDGELSDEDKFDLYLYACLLFVVPVIGALCQHNSTLLSQKWGLRARAASMGALCRKCLTLASGATREQSTGMIVTMMSSDAQKMLEFTQPMHNLWTGPLYIAVIFYLLYQQVGVVFLVGLGITLGTGPLTAVVAKKLFTYRREVLPFTDERTKLTAEVLAGVRVIKFYGWEDSFIGRITLMRARELAVFVKVAICQGVFGMVLFGIPLIQNVVVLVVYWSTGGDLTASKVFTTITLFNMMKLPLAFVPMLASQAAQVLVSLERFTAFLSTEQADARDEDCAHGAVSYKNATLDWQAGVKEGEEDSEGPTLTGVNLEVPSGQLAMVVGAVGSGKSSLLQAAIKSIKCVEGSVSANGKIAYVAQSAWIVNDTLRNNVIFGRPFDQERYDAVLEACELRADVAVLPGGDQTEIGERGINLSGGQKQRVSLARAVYSDADIYLLDDPLSAVDAHVGKALLKKCVLGVLASKTVVLATNALHALPQAEYVYVLGRGTVLEQGTYEEVSSAKGEFSALMDKYNVGEDDDAHQDEAWAVGASDVKVEEKGKSAAPAGGVDKLGRKLTRELTTKETREKGDLKLSYVWAWFAAGGGAAVWVPIVLMFCAEQATRALANLYAGEWSDELTAAKIANDAADDLVGFEEVKVNSNWYMGVYVGFVVANVVAVGARSMSAALAAVRASRGLQNDLLKHVMVLPMSFFDTTPLGRVLNRFSKDVDIIDSQLSMILGQAAGCMFNILAVFVVVSYATPPFLIGCVVVGLLYVQLQRFYIPAARELQRMESVSRSPIYSLFSESLNGVATIRAYGEQDRFIARFDGAADANSSMFYLQQAANAWLGMRLDVMGSVVVLLAAVLSIALDVGAATAGLSLSYALELTAYLKFGTQMISKLETQFNAVERVVGYRSEKAEPPHETSPEVERALVAAAPKWPSRGQLEFEDVTLAYRPGLEPVLRGVSFTIQGGEKVGICGRTGSGKSTLFLALFRLIEADAGRILVDGQDIARVGLARLRRSLAMIPQEPFLFAGTVRLNVDPFGEASDHDVWRALEAVELKGAVNELKGGLDARVDESGSNFSQGQQQLFCMARALLRNAPLLCMDEATALVDMETDDLIQRTVRTAFADCTVITIAHRLNTIMDSSRVLMMSGGEVAEMDKPSVLLERPNSSFKSLVMATGSKSFARLKKIASDADIAEA